MQRVILWLERSLEQWRYVSLAILRIPYWGIRRVLRREGGWSTSFRSRWGFVPKHAQRDGAEGVIWINALSGGEATQLVSFCRVLNSEVPNAKLVVSVGSGGLADFVRRNIPAVSAVFDTPWDIGWVDRKALLQIRPTVLVFIENVYSPILARNAQNTGTTTVLVSGLVNTDFKGHEIYRRAFRLEFYKYLDWFLLKEPSDASTLGRLSPGSGERTRVSGDLKFDFDHLDVDESDLSRLAGNLRLGDYDGLVLVAGSTHEGEAEIVLEAFSRIKRDGVRAVLIIAPRYTHTAPEIHESARSLGLSVILRSAINDSSAGQSDVVLVDTFGELAKLYSLADIIILGGTFFRRTKAGFGQNIIEPIMARKPVVFGPFIRQFRSIADRMKSAWGGLEVRNQGELYDALSKLIGDKSIYERVVNMEDELRNQNRSNVNDQAKHVASLYRQRTD